MPILFLRDFLTLTLMRLYLGSRFGLSPFSRTTDPSVALNSVMGDQPNRTEQPEGCSFARLGGESPTERPEQQTELFLRFPVWGTNSRP